MIQKVQSIYAQLMDLKKQDVYSDIQAVMGEIHQNAREDQKDIVEKADAALSAKKETVVDMTTLTYLDAMRSQIANIRQQYIKALMVPAKPDEKVVTASRSSIGYTIKLKSEEDIDRYVADIKEKLMEMLDGNDELNII